jgi:hypothetical protein
MSEGIAGTDFDWESRRDASSISQTAIDFTEAIVLKMTTAGRGSLG